MIIVKTEEFDFEVQQYYTYPRACGWSFLVLFMGTADVEEAFWCASYAYTLTDKLELILL